MLRVFLIQAFLFLLPAILYGGYLYFIKRRRKTEGEESGETPYMWLVLSGLILMAAGMLAMAYISGDDPSGSYVPARMENGKIIPGDVK